MAKFAGDVSGTNRCPYWDLGLETSMSPLCIRLPHPGGERLQATVRPASCPPRAAQALVETALALPVVVMLGLGVRGAARVTGALVGVTASAREAARAAVRAPDADTAWSWGTSRGRQVATEYGLETSNESFAVDVDVSTFEWWGEVRASVRYSIGLADVPFVQWAQVRVPIQRSHAEVLDPYRSE